MDYDYDGLLLLLFFMKENDWTVQYIKDKIRCFDKEHSFAQVLILESNT